MRRATGRAASLSKRERIARFCSRTGLIRLLEKIPPQPCLFVLSYHHVGRAEESLYDPDMYSATVEDLDDQVSYLKSRFHLASLEEVRELLIRRSAWRQSMVLLTFDDGYLDNYTLAFPILKSHGVQGIFFLATSFVGTRRLPWWDRIANLIRRTAKARLSLRYPARTDLDLAEDGVERAIRRANDLCKSPATESSERFLAELAEACEVAPAEEGPERQFLDWQEAEQMMRQGMAIGSHTHRHELLSTLTDAEEYDEVTTSRDILRERLGADVFAIAYPVGSPTSFSSRTCANIRRAGYEMGFSFYGGINLPSGTHPLDIRRVNVGRDLSPSLFRLETTVSLLPRWPPRRAR